jgi:hypothetical protein
MTGTAIRLRHALLAAALFLLFASTGNAQTLATKATADTPDFRVQIWGDALTDFTVRIERYVELRHTLENGAPVLTVTDDPSEITRAEMVLARRIRVERNGARQGDLFTPAISERFRRVLLIQMNADTRAVIMDDNPGAFRHRINGTYSKDRPVSTVPANVLAVLPTLPADIQYRFLGPNLILHDTRANVILDQISCAIECID